MAEEPLSTFVTTPETVVITPGDRTLIPAPFVTTLPSGLQSLPVTGFCVSQFHAADGQAYILVQLARHSLVLHEAFTPEAARMLAEGFARAADACEAAMLERTNAQLGAILAKGKGE